MGIIKILDEKVSNIIAAGEVVENYSSLIKELFENSLDANAKNIEIEINDKLDYIKISDDGIGMEKEDVYLSIERHATSKLKTKEDIFNLSSFGFRGEALASIASVSKLNLSSKTKDSKLGHKITCYGGSIVKSQDIAMKTGTIIEIRDLFYNTPARKKFLRKVATELSSIKDIVLKLSLSCPNVSIKLKIDGKQSLKTTGSGIDNTVYEVFGKTVFKNLKKFKYGYLGNAELFRASKNYIYIYVNKRYCKSNLIERAVIDAYYMKLMKGKYPFAIIFYDLNPSEVDVNVHPSKKIVKFSDDKIVYGQIKSSIEEFFYEDDRKTWTPEEIKVENKNTEQIENVENTQNQNITNNKFEYKDTGYIQSIFEVDESEIYEFDILTQVFDTYVVVKNKDSIDFYDQHAMHERITYEALKEKYYNQELAKKQLLIPELINLDISDKDILLDNMEIFKEFKFEIDFISEKDMVVRAVPDFELRNTTENVLKAMIDSLKINNSITDIRERIIISMACRSSIMAGQKLGIQEMRALVNKLHKINKFNCPHGRPVISKVTKDMLDKMAKRKL
ncbi:DNA mismatch repair endonuclease MutL [Oceanivirga salmonicida]|uniref:DNA mismatch repair endonuclease MutL n=1 Tax=Oceanivirga salmonicida TaxID=1769291 RepID=UPI000831F9D3|nr:DNA mismatch repair endonuclease MutL [Oceanivirga salmonicida]